MRLVFLLVLLVAAPAFAQDTPVIPQSLAAWPDTLIIELEPRPEHGPFYMHASMGGLHEQDENPRSLSYGFREELQGIPDSLENAKVYFHDFDFRQLTYQAYRHGRITPERALRAFASWSADTLTLTPEWVDARVAILVAKNDSQYVFVFDADNDESFAGETAVTLPLDPPEGVNRLFGGAEQRVAYEFFDGTGIREGQALLRIGPYLKPPGGIGPPMYLSGVHEHYVAEATTPSGATLYWFASRGTRDGHFRSINTQVLFFTERPADSLMATIRDEPYRTGEVLDLGGAFYRLEQVTPGGEQLVLSRAPEGSVVGLRTGMEAPGFAAATLTGDSLRLADLRGKHVLLEFWGTWCGPCVGEVPNLKEAYAAYGGETFEIVGIAQDEAQAVTDFVAKREMPWPQIVQDVEQDRTLLDAFRIQGFPTTLLIDPNGRIVARENALRGSGLMQTLRQYLGEPAQSE